MCDDNYSKVDLYSLFLFFSVSHDSIDFKQNEIPYRTSPQLNDFRYKKFVQEWKKVQISHCYRDRSDFIAEKKFWASPCVIPLHELHENEFYLTFQHFDDSLMAFAVCLRIIGLELVQLTMKFSTRALTRLISPLHDKNNNLNEIFSLHCEMRFEIQIPTVAAASSWPFRLTRHHIVSKKISSWSGTKSEHKFRAFAGSPTTSSLITLWTNMICRHINIIETKR